MQVEVVVGSGDDEEQVGGLAIWRAEEYRPFRVGDGDEWRLAEELVAVFGVAEGDAAVHCGRCDLLTFFQFLVELPATDIASRLRTAETPAEMLEAKAGSRRQRWKAPPPVTPLE